MVQISIGIDSLTLGTTFLGDLEAGRVGSAIAQIPPAALLLNPTLLWLLAGAVLCLMEFITPTAFVELLLGVSALIVAAISVFVPIFPVQVVLWLLLSTALVVSSRRFFTPKQRSKLPGDAMEGETLTAILPGRTGRVLYEGNSWRARCGNDVQAIAPHERVYVVGNEGNTLIVIPQNLLDS